ncbi:MAG: hypothetical protein COV10_04330 [Candidatus Vogelbacteria bacterium CG10_big_fil_rev_8_21_14_0_10_51_16]|uniref:Thioredoxin domain-containing protein n=1 Tax=Candidatus Vogelbacteria bacterium CG10_big_fil_rev_8_21_14_0_10_51_16 TaxID=1975045 RepID=A0A2H0RES8_9BACT|nr:MAG: hypothetical protein COV10_04330 [Candidatus Vogelbacteria bacterium CG10_big_fil_rev_8_21_14_0_10_51_16]
MTYKNNERGSATIALIILAVVVVGGALLFSRSSEPTASQSAIQADPSGQAVTEISQGGAVPSATATAAGTYEPYDASKIARAANGKVVIFFHASWCPTCRALDSDLKANLDKIPANMSILNVDYDTATALKQKYGVTSQSTHVQVDAQGNLITKWSGSVTLAEFLTHIK